MIGYFRVVNKDGQELARYKYSSITSKQKAFLRGIKNIRCLCCCNDLNLELKISSDLKIYPAIKDVGNLHDARCPKYIDPLKEQDWTIIKETYGYYYHQAGTQVNAKEYMKMVNTLTYERLISPILRLPDNYEQFNLRQHATLKYIQTPSGDRLYNISTTQNRNVETLPIDKEYFFCGMLTTVKAIKNNANMISLDILDCFNKKQRFYLDKDMYIIERSNALQNANKILVCGFAYKKTERSKILTISDFALSAISDIGILA